MRAKRDEQLTSSRLKPVSYFGTPQAFAAACHFYATYCATTTLMSRS